MRKRRGGEKHVVLVDAPGRGVMLEVLHDHVGVREHRALRLAGGPRGVQDGAVVRLAHDRGLHVVQDELHLGRCEPDIDRHRHRACRPRGVDLLHELDAVGELHRNAPANAPRAAQLADRFLQLGVRDPALAAHDRDVAGPARGVADQKLFESQSLRVPLSVYACRRPTPACSSSRRGTGACPPRARAPGP